MGPNLIPRSTVSSYWAGTLARKLAHPETEKFHILRPKIRESKGYQAKEVFAAEHILRYFVLQYCNFQNIWGNFEENLMDGKTNFRQEVPLNPLLPTGWKDFSELVTKQVLFGNVLLCCHAILVLKAYFQLLSTKK